MRKRSKQVDVYESVPKALETASIEWQALTLTKCLNEFAERITREYPAGATVEFKHFTNPGYRIDSGTVAKHQFPPADMASSGLLVTVAEEVGHTLGKWRDYSCLEERCVLVEWKELVYAKIDRKMQATERLLEQLNNGKATP